MIFTAITGSIGCGKTTIANILRSLGFVVYDADKWVKYLYYDKKFLDIIRLYFPETFQNGCFIKSKLRTLVFNDLDKLNLLERLIYPYLIRKLKRIIRYRQNKGLVFMDIALLYEKDWNRYFDYVILADVEKNIQKSRVMKRDNISAEEFDKINGIQMSMEQKRERADFIVDTGVHINKLKKHVIDIVEFLERYE
ncbi:MAG: dephospho-CoA kinase [Alphaproteobacteria bacterium]|nr:dephospho-CoA kinase [Alphaproteobacteria bacterium]